MKKILSITFFISTALSFGMVTEANAAVIQTIGAGTAVSTVDAAAAFENAAALYDNPYVESGISFSRTNLSFNNNGCGYAGCNGHTGFTNFSGNYMYGAGTGGFLTISSLGSAFRGIEFTAGSGYGNSIIDFSWQTFLGGTQTGSGSSSVAVGSILGFFDVSGFDQFNWATSNQPYPDFSSTYNASAFDNVSVQYAVPEPETYAMLLAGLGLMGFMARRRKNIAA